VKQKLAPVGSAATILKRLPKTWMHKSQKTAATAAAFCADLDYRALVLEAPSQLEVGGVGSLAGPSSIRWWARLEFDGFSDLFNGDRYSKDNQLWPSLITLLPVLPMAAAKLACGKLFSHASEKACRSQRSMRA